MGIGLLVGLLIGGLVGYSFKDAALDEETSDNGGFNSQQQNSRNTGNRTREGTTDRERGSISRSGELKTRAGELKTVELLDALANGNDKILDYLYVPLLRQDLSINMAEVEMLGLDPEQGKELETSMRKIFDEVRKTERKRFEVLTNEDDKVLLNIPAFDPADSEKFKEQIGLSFSAVLPEKLAGNLSSKFIESNTDLCGAILGRNRLFQIEPASEQGDGPFSDAKYKIKTVVLGRGVTHEYYKERGLNAFVEMSGWEESVESLPEHWKHLFESN